MHALKFDVKKSNNICHEINFVVMKIGFEQTYGKLEARQTIIKVEDNFTWLLTLQLLRVQFFLQSQHACSN